ncbi:hypothetical protein Nepgr_029643 [Nepenthes gracilis]|uniref:BSD domain-containing protein n=1 Tax=Nepenthes gracilis TaxID=150966 RepID=A0AAD3TCW4_NEPGR|nr:hypothetical protein Nepgr_029643 [Nepenthes gracilis]
MDFFRSVFADDSDPSSPRSKTEPSSSSSQPLEPNNPDQESEADPANSNLTTPSASASEGGGGGGVGWSFRGLVKAFSAKSETVIETYRRDLKEFGSDLKKETEVLRQVASRAVKDLPASIEIGASKAQGSLESVGQAIDSIGSTVWKSTAEIIAQGKESLLHEDIDSDSSDTNNINDNLNSRTVNSVRYSRFDVQLRSIQCDLNTYIDEPEDLDVYLKWKSAFNLEEKSKEAEDLMRENGTVGDIYKKVVPGSVNHEEFWCRYYYRVHRLKQREFVRANLVKRAISREDEEELSWDVDDEDEEEESNGSSPNATNPAPQGDHLENKEVNDMDSLNDVEEKTSIQESAVGHLVDDDMKQKVGHNGEAEEKGNDVELASENGVSNEKVQSGENSRVSDDQSRKKHFDEVASDGQNELSGFGKDEGISMLSPQQSPEEEDLDWDEIEDVASGDEKKVTHSGSLSNTELRKHLSAAVEIEDLSWDIEDDDKPVKT